MILLSVLIRKLGIEEKSEFSSLKGKIKKLVFYKLEIDKKKKNNKDLYIYRKLSQFKRDEHAGVALHFTEPFPISFYVGP